MSKKKKIIISTVSIVVVVALVIGGVFAYKNYGSNSKSVEVTSVAELYQDASMMASGIVSYGIITTDARQDIYLTTTDSIKTVYVVEGDSVKVGDPLYEVDTALASIELEQKGVQIQSYEQQIINAGKELDVIKGYKVASNNSTKGYEVASADKTENSADVITTDVNSMKALNLAASTTGAASSEEPYSELKAGAFSYTGDGTEAYPFTYLCTSDVKVTREFIESFNPDTYIKIEVREENDKTKDVIFSYTILIGEDGTYSFTTVVNPIEIIEDATKESVIDEATEPDTDEPIDEGGYGDDGYIDDFVDPGMDSIEPEPETEQTYTRTEKQQLIEAKESEIKQLEIDKRLLQLEYDQLNESLNNGGVVKATVDGVVKTAHTADTIPNDGSEFISIVGDGGYYVEGFIDEYSLLSVKVGDLASVSCWESGNYLEGEIISISTYPSTTQDYYFSSMSNLSYYPVTIHIEYTGENLRSGENADITINSSNADEEGSSSMYIESCFIRTDEFGKSYAYITDENSKLKKQYVTTGSILYGYMIEVKSGLSIEDYIAFPYGNNVKEGASTKVKSYGY